MSKWNFEDFLRRLEEIRRLGPSLEGLEDRLPGLGRLLRQSEFRMEELAPIEAILRAMSPEERLRPELLDGEPGRSRRERIATQSGTSLEEVDSLIWQFHMLSQMLEEMSPEEVTQSLMEGLQPEGEAWQTPADAWKGETWKPGEPSSAEAPALPAEAPTGPSASQRLQVAIDGRVDELLRKISRGGLTSLGPEERRFLDEASRRYREKRR